MTGHNLYTIIPLKGRLLKFSRPKSARAYYKNHYTDLLTGVDYPKEIDFWLSELDFPLHQHSHSKRFIHLFYELGFLFEAIEIETDEILGIDIQYSDVENFELSNDIKKIELKLISGPQFTDYEKQFVAGYSELTKGNCYQFNLTGEYQYSFGKKTLDVDDFISTLWRDEKKRGAYASATYIEFLNKLYLSNSPECLFQYANETLLSRPIKGTMKVISESPAEIKKLWKEMSEDKKSQAELFMITDLLRNDLSRIDLPRSVVTKKKAMLLVPGLIHQYSEISVKLRAHITLKNVLTKIFPGGSITGAPKNRTMRILKQLEKRTRGLYCGSTILFFPGVIEASINIRSSVIDFNRGTLSYQAGGGITLMSEVHTEFEEMTYKHDSFIDILTL